MVRVEVMFLKLFARVLKVHNLDFQPKLASRLTHHLSKLGNIVHLFKLVEDAVLPLLRRIFDCDGQALHGVPKWQESASLMAFAVNSQRMPDDRLTAVAVDGGAEALVEIQARSQARVVTHLVDASAKDYALHDVGGAQSPRLAGEHDVVRVMHLAPVIPASCLTRKGKNVLSTSKLNLEKALRDVNVRSAVFAHRAELDQVSVGTDLFHGIHDVERADDVVGLHPRGMFNVHHRIWSRRTLAEMNDCVWLEILETLAHKVIILEVALPEIRLDPVAFSDGLQSITYRSNRYRAPAIHLLHPASTQKEVAPADFVSASHQVNRKRPTQVSVHTRYEHPHTLNLHLNCWTTIRHLVKLKLMAGLPELCVHRKP